MMPESASLENKKLLLIDLDGVLVTDGCGDTRIGTEIITVHTRLAKQLEALNLPVAILTHRSRCEALQIIDALRLKSHKFLGIFTAKEILIYGLRFKGLSYLLRNGSRKSIILPYIEKRFNIPASSVAFIDDRMGNVEDLVNAGIGLGINVPAARVIEGARVETFDMNNAFEKVKTWSKQENLSYSSNTLIRLLPVTIDLSVDAASGIIMKRQWSDLFGRCRAGLRYSRQLILRLL